MEHVDTQADQPRLGDGAAGEHLSNLIVLERHGIHLLVPDLLTTLVLAALGLVGWYATPALSLVMGPTPALVGGLAIQAGLLGVSALLAFKRVKPLLRRRKGG